ncbi:MAG: NusG domain II-containing protein [Oscillospiraceae bacterium]|nr:NusG domain II-containing protein [Oscillospiraceae bacterium]
MKKGDIAAIAFVLALALGIFAATILLAPKSASVTVEIYASGEKIYSAPITENAEIPVSGDYHSTVVIRGGEVWVEDSDCPGGDCMRMGRKSRAGETIFCLPNRVEVRLSGSDLDMIAG